MRTQLLGGPSNLDLWLCAEMEIVLQSLQCERMAVLLETETGNSIVKVLKFSDGCLFEYSRKTRIMQY